MHIGFCMRFVLLTATELWITLNWELGIGNSEGLLLKAFDELNESDRIAFCPEGSKGAVLIDWQ